MVYGMNSFIRAAGSVVQRITKLCGADNLLIAGTPRKWTANFSAAGSLLLGCDPENTYPGLRVSGCATAV